MRPELEPRSKLILSRDALTQNFRTLVACDPKLALIPMVKANGYGHGVRWVAETLEHEAACAGFGVATLEEGSELRQSLGKPKPHQPIIVFSGTAPFTREVGDFCLRHQLVPVIATLEDWKRFRQDSHAHWSRKLPYLLKFQTGMHRLGIPFDAVTEVAKDIERGHAPHSVFSHLAISDDPRCPLSRLQRKNFEHVRAIFLERFPEMKFHLGNTGALWTAKSWKLNAISQMARPGIGLYGLLPDAQLKSKNLLPVMGFYAKVLHVFSPARGARIGYGGRTTIRTQKSHAAVIGVGYADGLPRTAWEKGGVWCEGKIRKFLGVISMDLAVIEATPKTRVGDWVELWGPHLSAWHLAKAAGTLPYELLTNVGKRSQRAYVNSSRCHPDQERP
jgi:alanine racemase